MAKFLIGVGLALLINELAAWLLGIPHIADYLSIVPLFVDPQPYYKVVPSQEPSYANYYVLAGSIAAVILGFIIQNRLREHDTTS